MSAPPPPVDNEQTPAPSKTPLVRINREEWKERAEIAKGQRQQTLNKHRCDDHLEDVLTTLFEDRSKFRPAWSTYWKSEPPRVLDIDYDERMRQQVREAREKILNQRRPAAGRREDAREMNDLQDLHGGVQSAHKEQGTN